MNDTLMNQCRREAEERYPMPVFASVNYVNTTDVAIAHAVVSARQEAHAALLYAERSKRPPMITVEAKNGVAGSGFRITPAQAESIYLIKEDIKAMLGGGDDDREWKRNVRNIERFLKANGFTF